MPSRLVTSSKFAVVNATVAIDLLRSAGCLRPLQTVTSGAAFLRETPDRRDAVSDSTPARGPSGAAVAHHGAMASATRPTFVYDGDCAFCTACARFIERRIPADVDVVPWQFADLAAL